MTRRKTCIANVAPYLGENSIRNIQAQHCERWLVERGAKIAPQTMAHELNAMRNVFDYAVSLGLMMTNPAKDIKRRKVVQQPMVIPTREQFKSLVATIRESDGRQGGQRQAKDGVDLVELLAYSGCRIHETVSIRWSHVDFTKRWVRVTGGECETKNHESRTIPMTEALQTLLLRFKDERNPTPDDFLSATDSAKKVPSNWVPAFELKPSLHSNMAPQTIVKNEV